MKNYIRNLVSIVNSIEKIFTEPNEQENNEQPKPGVTDAKPSKLGYFREETISEEKGDEEPGQIPSPKRNGKQ